MAKEDPALFGGKTVEEWDREWVPVARGLKEYQPSLRHRAGLYRMSLRGQVMALGTGTDKGGGLAKRLSDFFRKNASGRTHHAGQLIYENRAHLDVEVLITGSDAAAREVGRELSTPMKKLHNPVWNHPNAPYMRKG
ncbi:MAG: hypothetical protein ACT6TH_12315 [Brevundimonas sp.]|uniref:hypothetical protein n=1 Tax=Brevundimonas sp. TaxID=1871086 RepID=UPI0040337FE1